MGKSLGLAASILLASSAWAPGAPAGNVAVLMTTTELDVYQEALKGLRGALRHKIVGEFDMKGDLDRGRKQADEIRDKVKPDLVVAVGLYALQAVAERAPELPVVYAMVRNPPSLSGPGAKNITGVSMNVPASHALRVLKQVNPQLKQVGVIYDPATTGYLVKAAEAAARDIGVQLVAKEVRSPRQAIPALEALQQQGVDVIWLFPDETNLALLKQMLLVSYRQKIPLVGFTERHAEEGALLALSFASSEDIGRQAADLANTILGGKAPAEVPSTPARQESLTLHMTAAQRLGLAVPAAVVASANKVIQ
jgi:putative ABC transport system substrate-binding protein